MTLRRVVTIGTRWKLQRRQVSAGTHRQRPLMNMRSMATTSLPGFSLALCACMASAMETAVPPDRHRALDALVKHACAKQLVLLGEGANHGSGAGWIRKSVAPLSTRPSNSFQSYLRAIFTVRTERIAKPSFRT